MTGLVGACDAGYSCAYMNTISWRTPTTPLPMEINPRVIFERLFGDGGSRRAAHGPHGRRPQHSGSDHRDSSASAERPGQARPDAASSDYLDNIREIERRLQIAEKQGGFDLPVPDAPVGVPDNYEEHVRLMFDLMALAYQGDVSRVFTFMMARELSQRAYPQVGVPEPHHATSHHQDQPEKLAKLVKIQNYFMTLFGGFLDKLQSTPDGDGTLLDHSMILIGSCLSNSNIHNHNPLPVVLAGGAAGHLKGGRHLKYAENTPMTNLLVSMMHKADIPQDTLGDSTGPLTDL